jgi:hypothetical protein
MHEELKEVCIQKGVKIIGRKLTKKHKYVFAILMQIIQKIQMLHGQRFLYLCDCRVIDS